MYIQCKLKKNDLYLEGLLEKSKKFLKTKNKNKKK